MENIEYNAHAAEHQNWRNKQTKCKKCEHLMSFHGEDGCKQALLGVRAVPFYLCACVLKENEVNTDTPIYFNGQNTKPVHINLFSSVTKPLDNDHPLIALSYLRYNLINNSHIFQNEQLSEKDKIEINTIASVLNKILDNIQKNNFKPKPEGDFRG